jgi:hypothetical protein
MPHTDKRILAIARLVTRKRPKTVIDHIIEHGYITTEEIRDVTDITILPGQFGMSEKKAFPLKPIAWKAVMVEVLPLIGLATQMKLKGINLAGGRCFQSNSRSSC